jgi:hypothetical protein
VRKTALRDLEQAIKLYRAQNGQYPPQGCGGVNRFAGSGTPLNTDLSTWGRNCGTNNYILSLTPDYISQLPTDPSRENGAFGFFYQTNANRSEFKLMVYNTVERKTVVSGDELGRCPDFTSSCGGAAGDRLRTYAVYSPGAANW